MVMTVNSERFAMISMTLILYHLSIKQLTILDAFKNEYLPINTVVM